MKEFKKILQKKNYLLILDVYNISYSDSRKKILKFIK